MTDKKTKKKSEVKKELKVQDNKKHLIRLKVFDIKKNEPKDFVIKSNFSGDEFEKTVKIAEEILLLKIGINLRNIHNEYHKSQEVIADFGLEIRVKKEGLDRIPDIEIVLSMILTYVKVFGDDNFVWEVLEDAENLQEDNVYWVNLQWE